MITDKLPSWAKPVYATLKKVFGGTVRDPRNVFIVLIGTLVFALSLAQALNSGLFDSVERPLFEAINSLPHFLHSIFYGLTQFGGMVALLVWGGAAWYALNRRAMVLTIISGWAGWMLAKVVKASVERGRPGAFFDKINLFDGETFTGYGFPSGHATLSAACAAVLYYQLPRPYRKYLLLLVFLVGVSRMYLGAHFPLDIIGGWGLGAAIGAGIALLAGTTKKRISAQTLKKILRRRGYDMTHVRMAAVDARGSTPLFMEDASGTQYFAKIFGRQEHAADWLFKLHRFFRYKNLRGEEPFINSKRNIEMESFATLWAREVGVRVTRIVDIVPVRSSWMLIQEMVAGTPLADKKTISNDTLHDIWHQVNLLHSARLAHRDLRAANILIDRQGKAWIIDFGFAETCAPPERLHMDVAELLASMSLRVGIARTVASACAVLDPAVIAKALPYMQPAVFSGATLRALKKQKPHLSNLQTALHEALAIEEPVETVPLARMSWKRTLNVVLIALFFYVILPQAKEFSGAFQALDNLRWGWLPVLLLSSMATYYITGLVYVALANVPLKTTITAITQLAASYLSKVLPGGIGGAGLNVRYLTRAGMDPTDVSAVMATQGIVGFVMFIVPVALFLFMRGGALGSVFSVQVPRSYLIIGATVLALACIVLASVRAMRERVRRVVQNFLLSLRDITSSPRDVTMAAMASFGVTVAYILCLFAALRLAGLSLGVTQVVLVYITAIIAKSAIPTPGGLGPLEISMVASLATFGVDKGAAFAAVVLYRLATYWLPIPLSLLAYKYLGKKKYI